MLAGWLHLQWRHKRRTGPQRQTLLRLRTFRKTETRNLCNLMVTTVWQRPMGTTVQTTQSLRRAACRMGMEILRLVRHRRHSPLVTPPHPLFPLPRPAPPLSSPNAPQAAQAQVATTLPTRLESTSASTLPVISSKVPLNQTLSPRPHSLPSHQKRPLRRPAAAPKKPVQSSRWPVVQSPRSCLASLPSSRVQRRSLRPTIHLSAQTTAAWRRPCPRLSAGPQEHFHRGSDHPPSPGQTGATLHPSPRRSPAWPRPPPPQLRCLGLPVISLTAPCRAAAASHRARRESRSWTWWFHQINVSFDRLSYLWRWFDHTYDYCFFTWQDLHPDWTEVPSNTVIFIRSFKKNVLSHYYRSASGAGTN